MAGTGKPVGSTDFQDAEVNLENFDKILNSEQDTVFLRETPTNPNGKEQLTVQGMAEAATTGNPAVQAAQSALDYKNEAQLYAEAAATNADWVYPNVAAGEAARADGDYFWVVSASDTEVLELWRKGASSATDTGKRTISRDGFLLETEIEFKQGYWRVDTGEPVAQDRSIRTDKLRAKYVKVNLSPNQECRVFIFKDDGTFTYTPWASSHEFVFVDGFFALSLRVTGGGVEIAPNDFDGVVFIDAFSYADILNDRISSEIKNLSDDTVSLVSVGKLPFELERGTFSSTGEPLSSTSRVRITREKTPLKGLVSVSVPDSSQSVRIVEFDMDGNFVRWSPYQQSHENYPIDGFFNVLTRFNDDSDMVVPDVDLSVFISLDDEQNREFQESILKLVTTGIYKPEFENGTYQPTTGEAIERPEFTPIRLRTVNKTPINGFLSITTSSEQECDIYIFDVDGDFVSPPIGYSDNHVDVPINGFFNLLVRNKNEDPITREENTAEVTIRASGGSDFDAVRLTQLQAESLTESERNENNWYYVTDVDGSVSFLHKDDLPRAEPFEFTLSKDIPNGDFSDSSSLSTNPDLVNLVARSTFGQQVRHLYARVTGLLGKSPEFRSAYTAWEESKTLAKHRLVWSHDPSGDQWYNFDNQTENDTEEQWEFSNNSPFEVDTIYVANMPNWSPQRYEKRIKDWIANPLTSPTNSAVVGYRIGRISQRFIPQMGKSVPSVDCYAFKVGNGAIPVVLTSGVHPDEEPGHYIFEGVVDTILAQNQLGTDLRNTFTFYIYPNINGQGLYAGAVRVDVQSGRDCNRIWGNESIESELTQTYIPAWEADFGGVAKAAFDFHSWPNPDPNGIGRSLWYRNDIPSESAATTAFFNELRTYGQLRTNSSFTADYTMNYIMREIGDLSLAMTIEHMHDAIYGVSDWREFGVDVMRSLLETSSTL